MRQGGKYERMHIPLRAANRVEEKDGSDMSRSETFIIEVHETENATWQGEIIWANEKRRQYFRSALELIRLMDSVLDDDADRAGTEMFEEVSTLAS